MPHVVASYNECWGAICYWRNDRWTRWWEDLTPICLDQFPLLRWAWVIGIYLQIWAIFLLPSNGWEWESFPIPHFTWMVLHGFNGTIMSTLISHGRRWQRQCWSIWNNKLWKSKWDATQVIARNRNCAKLSSSIQVHCHLSEGWSDRALMGSFIEWQQDKIEQKILIFNLPHYRRPSG